MLISLHRCGRCPSHGILMPMTLRWIPVANTNLQWAWTWMRIWAIRFYSANGQSRPTLKHLGKFLGNYYILNIKAGKKMRVLLKCWVRAAMISGRVERLMTFRILGDIEFGPWMAMNRSPNRPAASYSFFLRFTKWFLLAFPDGFMIGVGGPWLHAKILVAHNVYSYCYWRMKE